MSELIGYNYVKERGRVYSAELPKGFDNDAASRIEVLQRMVEMHQAKLEEAERRIEALEKRCGKIAAFSYGDNDSRIKDHERRIEKLERKLNHKGGQE